MAREVGGDYFKYFRQRGGDYSREAINRETAIIRGKRQLSNKNSKLILSTGRVIEKIKKENKNKMVNYNCEKDKSTTRDYRIQLFFVFISVFISLLQVAIKKNDRDHLLPGYANGVTY